MRRRAGLVAAAGPVAAAAALVALGGPTYAISGACGVDGVAVVVDPGPLGGQPAAACEADGGGRTAAELLRRAGFAIEYAAGQPFVCRVDGAPGPRQESCARTPPADAYWGLFWSDGASATWTYSTLGVAALEVPGGGAVGLRFQDGGEPEVPRGPLGGEPAAAGSDDRGGSETEGTDGTPPLTYVAGAAVLLLGAAVGTMAWRRRR